jgi:hypothetical protein
MNFYECIDTGIIHTDELTCHGCGISICYGCAGDSENSIWKLGFWCRTCHSFRCIQEKRMCNREDFIIMYYPNGVEE